MLEIKKLNKIYDNGTHAIKDISFSVTEGEFLVIIGLSGSGKSTLLRAINRLITITSGSVFFNNENITNIKGKNLRNYRTKIGIIFQQFNLIKRRSVLTNVLSGSLSRVGIISSILNIYPENEIQKAMDYIKVVGLEGREFDRSDNLSGGQQQRVAIARALMQNPSILLADEPVASLDPATSNSVMKYLKKVNSELGMTVICNLHFLSLVREYASRVIALKDGFIVYEGNPRSIDEKWFKKIYGDEAMDVTIS